MKKDNFKKGKTGEEIAINLLKNKGFKIIEKNYKNSCGEIDIICEFKNMLIFIEVKARKNLLYGKPEEAVTYMKQKRIINSAMIYISNLKRKYSIYRFDVIAVNLEDNSAYHIENAFTAD